MKADQPDVPARHIAVSLGVEARRPAPRPSRRGDAGPRRRSAPIASAGLPVGENDERNPFTADPPGARESDQSVSPPPRDLSRKKSRVSGRRAAPIASGRHDPGGSSASAGSPGPSPGWSSGGISADG